ncbi:hypothetical protein [Psychroserpens algicola]|uniref:hypothetical protein n=1 Tax=Psychroserpens algicola TaxID=1719034 RepID=UPI0019539CF1|nr:hypothetical protein [Psychroserpens algicola]
MDQPSTLKLNALAFIIPLVLILSLVLLLNSGVFLANQKSLSTFITIDFIVTIPVIYFLLIRKRNISNLTVVPCLFLCILIASYTIPSAHQDALQIAKTWLIPLVELSVISLIILKVSKAVKIYKMTANEHSDFYDALVETCNSLFPKTVAKLVTNEIALIYYGFFNFKSIPLKPNEFSNYKGSGILSTLGAIIFVVAIEMVTVHVLVSKWSPTLAWILTILSIYSAFQLIGIIRSVPKRPIILANDHLHLRFGMLSETHILHEDISSIELINSSDYNEQKSTKTLSLLGTLEQCNIKIQLKTPQHLHFIYGKPKTFKTLLLFVDDNQNFKSQLESYISN